MGRSLRGFGNSLFDMWVQQDERDPGRRYALYVVSTALACPIAITICAIPSATRKPIATTSRGCWTWPAGRVDGPLRNIDAWYDAYAVKPGDRLYLPPEQRVRIW
jgi:hypothetical protein